MNKTITSFNIRNYSMFGTGRGGFTIQLFLQPFVGIFGGYIAFLLLAGGDWLFGGIMVFNVVGGLYLLQQSHNRVKNQGIKEREAFLEAWESEYGHAAPTDALDRIYWPFTRPERRLVTEAYRVDGVDHLLSVTNDGTLVLEVAA